MKRIFERIVNAESFSGNALYDAVQPKLAKQPQFSSAYRKLLDCMGKPDADYILMGIFRASFLIELVKTPKIETTKFEVRWARRLGVEDPRYATFEDCLEICRKALHELVTAVVDNEDKQHLLKLFRQHHMIPYEIPLDYIDRIHEGQMHRPTNIGWVWDDVPTRAVRLRHFLLSETTEAYSELFDMAYKNKIKVKTYLTDRVLTGAHKTNREKRWETHPGSVHFALRRSCLDIERTLIEQLCNFEGFPQDLRAQLIERRLFQPSTDVFRCPVTMGPLSFSEFDRELREPEHGKASFQIGHLNPLKAVNDDPQSGHTAQNISWVSADGNRIQGSLSLSETRELIRKIYNNYLRFDVK